MPIEEYNDITDKLKDLPRAQPPPQVWSNIERIINAGATVRQLSRTDWQQVAAVAAVIICLNTVAILWPQNQTIDTTFSNTDGVALISDYQLY